MQQYDKHLGHWRQASAVEFFEVNSLIDFDIRFFKPDGVEEVHSIYIRADIRTDLIIGLQTIKKYNFNLLQSHLDTFEHMYEVCSDSDTPAQILSSTQSIMYW